MIADDGELGSPRPMNGREPSVKGNALALLTEETQLGLASGTLLPRRLQTLPAALQRLVEDGVLNNEWYPIGYYSQLGELLCTTARIGRKDYLRELGVKDFARLRRARKYRQLDYLEQLETERDVGTKLQDSRLITTFMASIFNFSRWLPAPDPDSPKHIVIQVTDAEHVPEIFRFLTEGFQTAMNRSIRPTARAVRSERPKPDLIIFRSNGPRLERI
jgi:hypothetical protein